MSVIDKGRLEEYIYYISSMLKQEDFYDTYLDSIKAGKSKYEMSQRFQKKKFDLDWVEQIEDCVVSLDNIIRNPRKFIVVEEEIIDVSLARNITTESVKHLATHTNLIASVSDDGMVIPSKILNTSKEESFEIYENRFIYTLILKLHQFISKRFEVIKKAAITSDNFTVKIDSEYSVGKQKVKYSMETMLNMPLDEMVKVDTSELTDVERIARLASIVNGFLGSPFAKTMVTCALVRPPIIRTNVILKNPDFKKALVLWQFIDSYQSNGYEIKSVDSTDNLPLASQEKFNNLIYLNNILIESIVRQATTDEAIEAKTEEKKKKKDTEFEYITRNIDDFVPDDFPELKLSLFETRRVFTKLPEIAEVTKEEERKITRGIDRCLLQYKINKTKQDSEERAELIRKLVIEEDKAKVAALKAQKDAEKKAEREKVRAEKEAKRQEKLQKKLEKERLIREQQEREERIRREEEQALKERIEKEKAEAEQRILEENRRLQAIFDSEKARTDLIRQQKREEFERERQISFLRPMENAALVKLRKKEQQRIMKMRSAQELALREMITKHYQEMEAEQKSAILEMENIANLCDFDIFSDEPVATDERPEDIVITETPTAKDMEEVELDGMDIPEADTSLTTRDENGDFVYAKQAGLIEEEEDPTLARSKMTITETSYAPTGDGSSANDDFDEDIMLTGFDAPIDATAKYKPKSSFSAKNLSSADGRIARPSEVLNNTKSISNLLGDEWDFEDEDDPNREEKLKEIENRRKKEMEELNAKRKEELSQIKITGKNESNRTLSSGVFVPTPPKTIDLNKDNIKDVLNDHTIIGNEDEGKTKGIRKGKKKK